MGKGQKLICNLVFLGFFSFFMLFCFNSVFSYREGILCAWFFAITVDEWMEILTNNATSPWSKLKKHLSNCWNVIELLSIVSFCLGMLLRISPSTTEWGRVVLCLSLIFSYLQILQFLSVSKSLGPKLLMIGQMFENLMVFLVILLVFVAAYTFASESLLDHEREPSWDLLFQIPRKAYWTIYGELSLEDIEGTCAASGCPYQNYVVPVLMGIYVIITNVLLINLLIAMFSYTFDRIEAKTDEHWCFQRYRLVAKFRARPALPPPFTIISQLYSLFWYICHDDLEEAYSMDLPGRSYKDTFKEKKLIQWEKVVVDRYLMWKEKLKEESMEQQIQSIQARMTGIEEMLNCQRKTLDELKSRNETTKGCIRGTRPQERHGDKEGKEQDELKESKKKSGSQERHEDGEEAILAISELFDE